VGLPIVAMAGASFRSAIAAAMLRPDGLGHMVCEDVEAYVARACALAGDARLRELDRDLVRRAASPEPSCLRTAPFSRAFFDFVGRAAAAWTSWAQAIKAMPQEEIIRRISNLADGLKQDRNSAYLRLTDLALVKQLLVPYLKTLKDEGAPPGRIVDVGACVGEAALPLLRAGCPVDMFEPDPECADRMKAICATYPQARHLGVAVTGKPLGPVTFHKRQLGLSGIDASPFARGETDITVASTTLSEFYGADQGPIDMVKIDAEGHDLEILDGIDFRRIMPKVIMLEFGIDFAKHSPSAIASAVDRMAEDGYSVVGFSNRKLEGFGSTSWACELDSVTFSGASAAGAGSGFGNLIFFREGDTVFLACLLMMLDSFQPARQRQWGLRTT
jgi:FkbM family methyltransferase